MKISHAMRGVGAAFISTSHYLLSKNYYFFELQLLVIDWRMFVKFVK